MGAYSNNELADIEINLTDIGNARRLVLNYGNDFRWCEAWHKWLFWDGRRWAVDDILKIHQRAKDTIRIMYKEAADEFDENKRKNLAQHAYKCESIFKIKAMLEVAKSDVAVKPDLFDVNPWLLNVANGTLNLRTGELLPHIWENFITKLAPVEYDPLAECPKWISHLKRIMNHNQNLLDFLQTAYGYSLTGNTDERKMFIQCGTGANGKTTTNEVINEIMGDYAVRTPTETLFIKHDGAIPNDVAKLNGARFVFCSEAEEGKKLAESLIKDITGGTQYPHVSCVRNGSSLSQRLRSGWPQITNRLLKELITLYGIGLTLSPSMFQSQNRNESHAGKSWNNSKKKCRESFHGWLGDVLAGINMAYRPRMK